MIRRLPAGTPAVGAVLLVTLATAAAPPAPALRLLFTGEAKGYLEPCGCAGFKEGGVPRRATLLSLLSGQGTSLYVDNGDLITGADRQNQLKAEIWAELFRDMGLDALNLGEAEWSLGLEYLEHLQRLCGAPFLCANARGLEGDSIRPFTVVERAGRRIALVGVLSDAFLETAGSANPQLQFVDSQTALAEIGTGVAADFCVLLYHGSAAEAKGHLARHSWIDLAVAAHEGESPLQPQRVGRALVVTAGQKSKAVGEVALQRVGTRLEPGEFRALTLDESLEDSPSARALLDGYLERLRAENLLAQVPRMELPEGMRYVGASKCARCHAEEYRTWRKTRHANAFQSMVDTRHDADPECVVCHVVGLNETSGFEDLQGTPDLKDIGCEACHGPGSSHAAAPEKEKPLRKSKDWCLTCHVPDHSPKFHLDSYWDKVKH